jgi:hypothetical protein
MTYLEDPYHQFRPLTMAPLIQPPPEHHNQNQTLERLVLLVLRETQGQGSTPISLC